ncbi:MAG TPA: hypothetical protein VJN94_06080 [Candidatus Binataceae bacterium]|nr:hypothetical protein [Candidatus Binataceae bacterium]
MKRVDQLRSLAVALAGLMLVAVICGCSGSDVAESYSAQQASEAKAGDTATQPVSNGENAAPGPSDIAGVWQGTTLALCGGFTPSPSRCNAQQRVTITLLDEGGKLTGKYKCAYGNMDCYHMNTSGKVVDVARNGARMNIRVQMPDGTSCLYTGVDIGQSVNGGYSCYAGGSQIEEGSWRAQRSY